MVHRLGQQLLLHIPRRWCKTYIANSTEEVDARVTQNGLTYDMIAQALASKLMAPILNQADHPTHVILDNGCTKSTGSWCAVEKFKKEIETHPRRMTYDFIPCNTRFTLASGQQSKVDWTLRLYFNTQPFEQGQVPILITYAKSSHDHGARSPMRQDYMSSIRHVQATSARIQ